MSKTKVGFIKIVKSQWLKSEDRLEIEELFTNTTTCSISDSKVTRIHMVPLSESSPSTFALKESCNNTWHMT